MAEKLLCWYMLGYPKRRCQNEARWHWPTGPNGICRDSQWCGEHRHKNDVPLQPTIPKREGD